MEERNTMKKRYLIGCLLTAVCLIASFFGYQAYVFAASNSSTENQTIPNNVYIGAVSVSGMTKDEAVAAVNNYINGLSDVDVTLKAGENKVLVKTKELGLSWGNTQVVKQAQGIGKTGNLIKRYKDLEDLKKNPKVFDLVYVFKQDKIQSVLKSSLSKLNTEAKNATLTRENGQFHFVAGTVGINVQTQDSVKEISNSIGKDWDGQDLTLDLQTKEIKPEGTQETLAKVKDLLGSFHTNFSSSTAQRKANVKIASSKINGSILYPGEELSVYKKIAPLNKANGYELAGAYENGVTVQSYGGGVCQVSTTLYNAVLLSELNVTQRSNHSMLVPYVEPSKDAAIAGTYKDLKFKNNLKAPIYIEAYTQGNELYFNIYGQDTRPANRTVTYQSEVTGVDPQTVQIVGDAGAAGTISTTQKAHIGKSARLWKIVTVDGVEQSRKIINTSRYKSSPKILSVGTSYADPNVTAAINAAIGTQDEATVRAAIAPYAAELAAQKAAAAAAAAAPPAPPAG